LALSGGVGGAKLAQGLAALLPTEDLVIVANTGDDFVHLGLHISPDIDSITYALAGVNDMERGWGRAGETWNVLDELRALGGPDWFQLGDRDVALHLMRAERLGQGATLSEVTAFVTRRLGIAHTIAPMCDQPVRTMVATPSGELPFQQYFVAEKCAPRVLGFRFDGASSARPSGAFAAALASPRLECVIVCPSNPFISIDPILAIPGVRDALRALRAPVVAVSPIVGGQAIKGPAAKMMAELGDEASAAGIARHYTGLIGGLIIDSCDVSSAPCIRNLGIEVRVTQTVMNDGGIKRRLAESALDFAACFAGAESSVSVGG
jgi:LPPG:FO 2-phospho-L-lactate transferase